MKPPAPRPALRRADDADIHPALSAVPSEEGPVIRTRLREVGKDETITLPSKVKPAEKKPRVKPSKQKEVKRATQPFLSAGKATSDVYRTHRDKKVSLDVKVPKSVRKAIRSVARASDSSPDELVTQILKDWLGDPRRW